MIECYILMHAHSSNGEIVFLDFPSGIIPSLGMQLRRKEDGGIWQIVGMGLPIIIDMAKEKIESPYNSSRVWDCLLNAIGHESSLKIHDVLEVVVK